MKGDFSQLDPRRDERYDAVLHQQGRLWLDSDWNAEVFERLARLERETRDVVGLSGFPADAFKIGPGASNGDFAISGGSGPAGRAYVDGMLCELRRTDVTYRSQPDFPNAPRIVKPGPGKTARAVVYLEVWRRLITYVQDPAIREVALGGPDTALRLKTIAQVKVAPADSSTTCANAQATLPADGSGTLSTHVAQPKPPPDPCTLPDPEGYTAPDNRLYRVEIHDGGDVGTARFKWSRNNACDAVAVTPSPSDRRLVTLSSLGRDSESALRKGDLVEISDDASDLGPARGFLTYLNADPDPDTLTVRLADPLPPGFGGAASPPVISPPAPPAHLVLRRWDGQGITAPAYDPVTTPHMNLQDGIWITFGGSDLRSGDYWVFTARSADASVQILTDAKPAGIARSRVPLALVTWSADGAGNVTFSIDNDCRPRFSALTGVAGSEPALNVQALHCVGVSGGETTLDNDAPCTPTRLAQGIRFVLGTAPDTVPPDPDVVSVTNETCYGTIDAPLPPLKYSVRANLGGIVGVEAPANQPPAIRWRLADDVAASLSALRSLAAPGGGVTLRFTLHGDCIWRKNDPQRYLDGDAFGVARKSPDGHSSIALVFPSGDGRRGGDFETWFSLVPDVQQSLSVYVADLGPTQQSPPNPAQVSAFPAIGGALQRALTDPANFTNLLSGIAVDKAGFIYAAAAVKGQKTGNVFVYKPNSTSGPPTKTVSGLGLPWGVTVDANGAVYVADGENPVIGKACVVVSRATGNAQFFSDPSLPYPKDVAVDPTGKIYVTNLNDHPKVVVFDPKGDQKTKYINGSSSANWFGIALGPAATPYDGEIYVTDSGAASPPSPPSVAVYARGAPNSSGDAKPIRTITSPQLVRGSTYGCALDQAGFLYVVSGTDVLVFLPGADGAVTPFVTIRATAAPPSAGVPVMFLAVPTMEVPS